MGLMVPVNDCTFPFHFSVLSPFFGSASLSLSLQLLLNTGGIQTLTGALAVSDQISQEDFKHNTLLGTFIPDAFDVFD